MEPPSNTVSELIGIVKSWIPWRSGPTNVSRDFWMPDHSCRVCYECDTHFNLFNRRHHCRVCGRIFCAKCTANTVPASFVDVIDTESLGEERLRACDFCYQLWEERVTVNVNGTQLPTKLSRSPSEASFASIKSSDTVNSSSVIHQPAPYSESHQRLSYGLVISPRESAATNTVVDKQGYIATGRTEDPVADMEDPSLNCGFFTNRSDDDDDDDYNSYHVDSKSSLFSHNSDYYDQVDYKNMRDDFDSLSLQIDEDNALAKSSTSLPVHDSFESHTLEPIQPLEKKDEQNAGDECEESCSMYAAEGVDAEPVDFENNGLLWLPPDPEDEEDEREDTLFADDDDDGDAAGEWGYLRTSSSFESGEYRNRDKSTEEHKKAMKNVVDGHFRALISQLLQVENLPIGEEDDSESWLEIITALSWEAATLLKPDTSRGGGMDPGGYVKVKCVAAGRRWESMVVKGVVCKKNVAHRRMTSKIEKPRLLILGGALEYQRVSNLLSSFDTLLQQEMDHLRMAVARIDAHQPDVLLVEKSVSRFAQDCLLAKDISLVLNIKRPLLERIARCTGAQIIPSIDNLSSQKLGYCEMFHVERFMEEHGTAGQAGKKSVKTLMYFEGCPKPLGCTILLRGANGDELKKVKHVVQYGVFAAYHLALETSFLADEGASLPDLPLNSPITVALPDKSTSIDRSISTVPGFSVTVSEQPQSFLPSDEQFRPNSAPSSMNATSVYLMGEMSPQIPITSNSTASLYKPDYSSFNVAGFSSELAAKNNKELLRRYVSDDSNKLFAKAYQEPKLESVNNSRPGMVDNVPSNRLETQVTTEGVPERNSDVSGVIVANPNGSLEDLSQPEFKTKNEETGFSKEEFPPSPSDHQSILVSLSSRCVWKGTVCERSHLFRIKYYGSFDKPLGRFLRDHLFDQTYCCRFCEMPAEAHVHCYTHRQGTLTISVKKLPEMILHGEKEGKIWMWHRCLRCPRTNGFPPATRRVVMSDAAWGLSFGKFLELSFSNHAAASRVASCGHSLHRDCLRFYGYGKMVACFRYASIDVHSVYVPPPKLDFNYKIQDWIQKEADQVVDRAELLFSEVLNALRQISEINSGSGAPSSNTRTSESRRQILELEGMLQREKAEFEESIKKTVSKEVKDSQPVVDILELNRLRRELLFQSYMWDHRLVYAANLDNKNDSFNDKTLSSEQIHVTVEDSEKYFDINEKLSETDMSLESEKGYSSDSHIGDTKFNKVLYSGDRIAVASIQTDLPHQGVKQCYDANHINISLNDSAKMEISEHADLLDCGVNVRRALSEGQFPIMADLSDTLDAAWTGDSHPDVVRQSLNSDSLPDAVTDTLSVVAVAETSESEDHYEDRGVPPVARTPSLALLSKSPDNLEETTSWLGMPFLSFYRSLNKNFLGNSQKLDTFSEYSPVYISSFRESELQGGARLLLPVGLNETVIPVIDDEPTSIIAYALMSPEYRQQLSDDGERMNTELTMSLSFVDSSTMQSFHSLDEFTSETFRSLSSTDDSILSLPGSRSSSVLDPLSYTKTLHARVSFSDDGPLSKVKYTVTCYYAKRFEALRRICCPSELDYVRSLSRCKKWGAQGGKSNVFFAKTLDDRFIIKQVTKTELESFIKFAPAYFKYLSESIGTRSPTCLAKILGIYQVISKNLKGGKETRMDVLVMENLLFGRSVTKLYDLKGSSRSRYNPDSSGNNKVLLDQNLIEAMPTSPIFVGNKAKRLLERAVWNDTAFLASIDVMDYSLLVGMDETKHELVLGIIDFMRQYTWDKHLETWVKASGILGGPKNASPTVISPKQYKKRFRKAMTTYFLMVPDQWSPPSIIPSKSQIDLCEEDSKANAQSSEL
uniref:1-phosphatidylinositol-3-phosphate 5-kinase n=2 Tax=Kalanchoe fedtschenkoi TaxID=63787 RepID=A0A7N0T2Y2_KALFE